MYAPGICVMTTAQDADPVRSVVAEHDSEPSVNVRVSFATGFEVSASVSVPESVAESW